MSITSKVQQRLRASTGHHHFPVVVRERLKVSHMTANRNLQAITERMGAQAWESLHARLKTLVRSSDPTWLRLRTLYALADEFGRYAACRRGCAHCCHIQVGILEPEAQMLGKALHRKPKSVATTGRTAQDFDRRDYGYHTPCTFLENGECSIYENRPLACRTLVNLDEDALLCELLPPPHAPTVPYMNMMNFQIAYNLICGSSRAADIREYFPRSQT